MSTFTLAISCLTTSNLPWFMDLTFQVPMQYCSLQHQTLLLSPVTSTTGYSFCVGSIPSFFLELFLYWSPVAYWAPTNLGSSCFSILSFCLFILFMGFLRQEYWSGLPFPSPVGHILSDLSSMTCPSGEPRGATAHSRSGGVAVRRLHRCVCLPLLQGKQQWLRFAGAALKRYPTSKVRETQVRW